MKKKPGTKLAIAIAIIQHPAVQKAAREIGAAGLRKAREWWQAKKATRRVDPEKPKALPPGKTARRKKPTAAKNKTIRKRSPATKTKT